jgi:hypothetical protein
LSCTTNEEQAESVCECANGNEYTEVNSCVPNHYNGQMSTGCLGVADVQTAWINEFLTGIFIPISIPCCDTHDMGSCVAGNIILAVDTAFSQCMRNVCEEKYGDPGTLHIFKKNMKKWCLACRDCRKGGRHIGTQGFQCSPEWNYGGSC